jgi:hypothetical protein
LFIYKYIRNRLKEINPDEDRVVNVLVEELYGRKKSPVKTTLWNCYGDILLSNLRENLKGTKQCECCGTRIQVVNNKIKYCDECGEIINREKTKERMRLKRKMFEIETA